MCTIRKNKAEGNRLFLKLEYYRLSSSDEVENLDSEKKCTAINNCNANDEFSFFIDVLAKWLTI